MFDTQSPFVAVLMVAGRKCTHTQLVHSLAYGPLHEYNIMLYILDFYALHTRCNIVMFAAILHKIVHVYFEVFHG